MTVTHKRSVTNFDAALKQGGSHPFEITVDEMPELEAIPGVDDGVEIVCRPSTREGVWISITNRIAAAGGRCTYTRKRSGTYDVLCHIPVGGDSLLLSDVWLEETSVSAHFVEPLIATALALKSGALTRCPFGLHLIQGTGDRERAVALALARWRVGMYRGAFESEAELRAAVEQVIMDHPYKDCACYCSR